MLNNTVISSNCSAGAIRQCSLSCEADNVILAWWSSRTQWGRCQTLLQWNTTQKVDWTWRAHCMASYAAGMTLLEIFAWDNWKIHWHRWDPTFKYLIAGLQAAVAMVGANILINACLRKQQVAYCHLPGSWRKCALSTYCNQKVPMVYSSDNYSFW